MHLTTHLALPPPAYPFPAFLQAARAVVAAHPFVPMLLPLRLGLLDYQAEREAAAGAAAVATAAAAQHGAGMHARGAGSRSPAE